ncbi:dienelactone hydrolase family protein [Nisaea acidiphila]|uniref:Dienelactone hydrolase family protein n=1 Tax=Nisaea acidiphila TaxID=1862145 RepID=A0A9J7ALF5_9PROT|nr:dienelactone hydrolase family protein [Nisaea acidiphila]UUX48483.1 dienelactone hydrolase family protein [Nisaea acidiphila]
MDEQKIDPKIYALYDEYCHSGMERREFLRRAAAMAVVGGSGLAMAQALLPDYAAAQTVSFTDPRIKATYELYDSPGGNGEEEMRGYLVQPAGSGPFPAVLVIHENRGLNPHIEDVARRAAVEGFLAFAPDGLWPLGGYPGNDDDGKVMQRSLDRDKLMVDLLNGAKFLKDHPLSNGKLGATGFCFGGGVTNWLATEMGADLAAGVPFYGRSPEAADVPNIKAAMMVQYAEEDPRINAGKDEYEAALKANGVDYRMFVYPGTKHGFHNNSTPRYDETQAKIAWERTVAHFREHLAG